jgi:hypothetical protein
LNEIFDIDTALLNKDNNTDIQLVKRDTVLNFSMPNTPETLLKNKQITAQLLIDHFETKDFITALMKNVLISKKDAKDWLTVALVMNPEEYEKIRDAIGNIDIISNSEFEIAALSAGIERSQVITSTSSEASEYRITPLISSASITIYQQAQGTSAKIYFKRNSSQDWLQGNDLHFDPYNNALSGSLVYLNSDSNYDLKIDIFPTQEQVKKTPSAPR